MTTAAAERSALTSKQQRALNIVKDGGKAKDIAAAMSITNTAAYSFINALKRKGFLNKDGSIADGVVAAKPAVPKTTAKRSGNGRRRKVPESGTSGTALDSVTVTSTAKANGSGSKEAANASWSKHPSFNDDQTVGDAYDAQRDVLAKTVARIDQVITDHAQRRAEIQAAIAELQAEDDAHTDAQKALSAKRDATVAAIEGLG